MHDLNLFCIPDSYIFKKSGWFSEKQWTCYFKHIYVILSTYVCEHVHPLFYVLGKPSLIFIVKFLYIELKIIWILLKKSAVFISIL